MAFLHPLNTVVANLLRRVTLAPDENLNTPCRPLNKDFVVHSDEINKLNYVVLMFIGALGGKRIKLEKNGKKQDKPEKPPLGVWTPDPRIDA